ncbi:MAG: serine/threonine protein kinase, partial [Acidobacteria bacterium]|nr:serine/threonine protein kinase [Acidobacteriota bacterium]
MNEPYLASGSRLGPYEIVGLLGAGGMGEVYRARDPRLHRELAIKVLPAALASNPERLRRFRREASAAAALNHPNICTIHEIGDADGRAFIVMEYVEGATLRDSLSNGPLSPSRVVSIALQIADALEA